MNDQQFAELVSHSDINQSRNYVLEVAEKYLFGKKLLRYFKMYNKQIDDAVESSDLDKEVVKTLSYKIYDKFKVSAIAPYMCHTYCGMSPNSDRFSLYIPTDITISEGDNIIFRIIENDCNGAIREGLEHSEHEPSNFNYNDIVKYCNNSLKNDCNIFKGYYHFDLYVENSIRKNSEDKDIKFQSIKLILKTGHSGNIREIIEVFWCSDLRMMKTCNEYSVNGRRLRGFDDDYASRSNLDLRDVQRTYRSKEPIFSQEAIDYFKYLASIKFRIDVSTGYYNKCEIENFDYILENHESELNPEFANVNNDHFSRYVDNQTSDPKTQFYTQLAFKYAISDNPIFNENANTLINNHDYWFSDQFMKFKYEFDRHANYKSEPLTVPMIEHYVISDYRMLPDYYMIDYWSSNDFREEYFHNGMYKAYLDKGVIPPQYIPAPDISEKHRKTILHNTIYKGFVNNIDRVIDVLTTQLKGERMEF